MDNVVSIFFNYIKINIYKKGGFKLKKNEKFPDWVKSIILLCLGWTSIYMIRGVLTPVMGDIQIEFDLTQTELGLISSVFFLGYTAMQIPAGLIADKIGKRFILIPGIILFTLGQFGAGLMTTFGGFILFRILTGIGQGTYYGPSYSLSSQTIPSEKRGISSAIINSGTGIGTATGLIGASFLAYNLDLGWRAPFYASAAFSLVVGLLFWKMLKEPPKPVVTKTTDNGEIEETEEIPVINYLFKPKMLAAYFVNFASNYGFFMVLTWLPYYLETERAIPVEQTGFFAALVALAGIPGSIIISRYSDKLKVRKPFILLLLPLAAISLSAIVYIQNWNLVVLMLVIYGFIGKLAVDPILIAFIAEDAPKKGYGTMFSLFNCMGMASSILAPTITGFISDRTDSMVSGFYLGSIIILLSFVAILFVKEKKTPQVS